MHWGRRILGGVWAISVILSALLFLSTVGIWVRSYWQADWISYWSRPPQSLITSGIGSEYGRIVLARTNFHWEPGTVLFIPGAHLGWHYAGRPAQQYDPFRPEGIAGFGYRTSTMAYDNAQGGQNEIAACVPHWFIALLTLPLPLIAIRRWRKQRRIAREGLCRVCGYDLRASAARCPECGTAIERVDL